MSENSTTKVTDRYGNEVPAELDGVDLKAAFDCPSCGAQEPFLERPAGYYTCPECWSTWAGDPEDADIVDYVRPSVSETNQNGE